MTVFATKDLILSLRRNHEYPDREARRVVHDVLDTVAALLEDLQVGDQLRVKSVGTFHCRVRKGRVMHIGPWKGTGRRTPNTLRLHYTPSHQLAALHHDSVMPEPEEAAAPLSA